MLVWTLQYAPLVVATVTYKVETGIYLRQPDGIKESKLFMNVGIAQYIHAKD